MDYKQRRAQCEVAGFIKTEGGVDVCGCSRDKRCWGHSCPSIHGGAEVSKHKWRAIDAAGLTGQFKDDMDVDKVREGCFYEDDEQI